MTDPHCPFLHLNAIIHTAARGCSSLALILCSIPSYKYSATYLFCWWTLDHFQSWAIVNIAAVSTLAHVFWWTWVCTVVECVTRSLLAVSKGVFIPAWFMLPENTHQQCKSAAIGSHHFLWRRDRLPTPVFLGFPGGSAGKESAWSVGDLGSIPGMGRSPGEGNGYPLQYSCLEYSMDYTSMGSQRVGHDWATLTSLHYCPWNGRLSDFSHSCGCVVSHCRLSFYFPVTNK